MHPEAQDLFLFDNASHCKMADDTPNVEKMNASPDGKEPVTRGTIWEGKVQKQWYFQGYEGHFRRERGRYNWYESLI